MQGPTLEEMIDRIRYGALEVSSARGDGGGTLIRADQPCGLDQVCPIQSVIGLAVDLKSLSLSCNHA